MTRPANGAELARAAAALEGVPWRLHGRDPVTGLDCVGLVGAALDCAHALPSGYPLRLRQIERWLPEPAALGLVATTATIAAGDIVLLRLGPAQYHLAIAADDCSWVHAHAGLRRIVRQAVLPPGEHLARWRIPPQAD